MENVHVSGADEKRERGGAVLKPNASDREGL
jgi:hypothetical protein